MYNFTLFEVPDPSIFISDWLMGIRPVSGSGSSKTEGNFIFDSYTEWWSSIVELPRILRSSAKLVLLFRYGSVSFKIDKGGWFFINRDDIEGWDVVDSVEISLLWLSMFVNSCWLEGTPMAERERKLDSFNGGEPRRRVEQSWTVPDFFVQSRSGRPLVELKLSLESFWVRSKWPAGDVSFKRFSKFRKSESHGLHACMDRGKDSLFQRSINRKRTRISLLGARSCPALHSPWSACRDAEMRSPCCQWGCKDLDRPSSKI